MESPSAQDRSAALAAAHGLVSLLRAFAAADAGDLQPLHLWSTVNGAVILDGAVADVGSRTTEQPGTQITAAISVINYLVAELAEETGRSTVDILESLQNALADEENWT